MGDEEMMPGPGGRPEQDDRFCPTRSPAGKPASADTAASAKTGMASGVQQISQTGRKNTMKDN
jgi:hypothetical protein